MSTGYSPHRVQKEAHRAFLVDEKERGCIFWARRVGKTLFSAWHLRMAAQIRQGPYWAIFDTRQHAKEVLWETLLNIIPEELTQKRDHTDLHIVFKHLKGPVNLGDGEVQIEHDTSKPPSSIRLSGSDTADRDRGGEANGIIFDEYQDQDPNNWDAVYNPFLATTEGWACFMGTAKGYNHWYDLMEFAKRDDNDWFYSEATWRDTPHVTKRWIEESRETAKKRGKLDIWEQEYELAFRTAQGSVYPMFDRKVHIVKPDQIPEDGTHYGVLDFGWSEGHPMAWNHVVIDTHGKWYVADEIHGTEIPMDDLVRNINEKMAGKKLTLTVADSARPDLIDVARKAGLNVVPSPKRQNSIQSGIMLLAQRLTPKIQLAGKPEPDLYFSQNCRNTIIQFEQYKYKEAKDDRPASELPIKAMDDHPDALRYLALYLKYGLTKKKKPIKSGVQFDERGLLRI